MRRPGRAVGAAVAAAAACMAACAPSPPDLTRANVVLVLVDALRADRLSLYGYERPTSPELERLAGRAGVVFRNAWSGSGCTFPSVATLMTSRWPQRILSRRAEVGKTIPPEMSTLAELLAARGWRAEAISTSISQPASEVAAAGLFFARGFEIADSSCHNRSADCVNAAATARLDELPEPFFLYLHYLDPHGRYQPPASAERHFATAAGRVDERWVERGDPKPVMRGIYDTRPPVPPSPEAVRRLSDLYDDEVRYFDGRFGELFAELERRGLLARTIVALVSDHGEELFDNGGWGHCRDLGHDSVLRTPMLFFVPGVEPGERHTAVSNLDVAPTLLDLLGIPYDAAGFDGESLRRVLTSGDDEEPGERIVFSAQGVVRVAASARSTVRFDLRRGDWLTRVGAIGSTAERAEELRLRRALVDWIRAVDGVDSRGAIGDAEALERELRAIGYL